MSFPRCHPYYLNSHSTVPRIPPRHNGRTRSVLLPQKGVLRKAQGCFSRRLPLRLAPTAGSLCLSTAATLPVNAFSLFNYIYINAITGFCQSFFHRFRSLIDTKSFCCTGSDTAHNFAIKNPAFFNNIYTIFMKIMNRMGYNCFRGMNMEAIQVFLTHSITPKFTIFFLSFC